jgi:ABC-type uncharacterized transport system ATPase subunit
MEEFKKELEELKKKYNIELKASIKVKNLTVFQMMKPEALKAVLELVYADIDIQDGKLA